MKHTWLTREANEQAFLNETHENITAGVMKLR